MRLRRAKSSQAAIACGLQVVLLDQGDPAGEASGRAVERTQVNGLDAIGHAEGSMAGENRGLTSPVKS
jgi:hypothetical protein